MKLPVLSEEFPPGADALDGSNRRDFLKLLGGTLALAGACTCQPAEHAAPRAVEPLTVGGPLHYATCITLGGLGTPLLVTARDGRPVKIEGNPEHPLTLGASGPLEQAELLRLYDPSARSRCCTTASPAPSPPSPRARSSGCARSPRKTAAAACASSPSPPALRCSPASSHACSSCSPTRASSPGARSRP
ncbi:MAG: hypothetical protein IPJ65_02585 [Archangiaceae bacterium]|nr:hypothetical protein [Archangiaceae bacterium]